jgi:hypothetical protein
MFDVHLSKDLYEINVTREFLQNNLARMGGRRGESEPSRGLGNRSFLKGSLSEWADWKSDPTFVILSDTAV